MLSISVWALLVVAWQAAGRMDPAVRGVLEYADFAVCGVFFADFLLSLWRASDRWGYFLRWGWLDLLSSVPTLDFLRWGRLGRVLRILRVLRALRASRILAEFALERRAENTLLAAGLLTLLVVVSGAVAVLQFEGGPESNIRTAEDALWWAVSTITTVGYGDRYPVTPEGRLVAVMLMAAGVGLFGVLTAYLASWFVGSRTRPGDAVLEELARLRAELLLLRGILEGGTAESVCPGPDGREGGGS
ncbi:MAG: potassium channel family protein [bacterium]